MLLRYTPLPWREGRVVFIPKPGKATYQIPKSFRPITLTSFIFKTLEKLINWHLDITHFQTNPLHTKQFAFRVGRSCDEALSLVTDKIERGQANKIMVLGVFLDIQGAFDNVQTQDAIASLYRRGIPDHFIQWYEQYIKKSLHRIKLRWR